MDKDQYVLVGGVLDGGEDSLVMCGRHMNGFLRMDPHRASGVVGSGAFGKDTSFKCENCFPGHRDDSGARTERAYRIVLHREFQKLAGVLSRLAGVLFALLIYLASVHLYGTAKPTSWWHWISNWWHMFPSWLNWLPLLLPLWPLSRWIATGRFRRYDPLVYHLRRRYRRLEA